MEHPITFYVTRHGQSLFNLLDRAQGWCDTPLTQTGLSHAQLLGRGLSGIPFSAVYTSDSGRAVQTAKTIVASGDRDLPIYRDSRLREWCFGSWEGVSNREFMDMVFQNLPPDVSVSNLNHYLPQIADTVARTDSSGWAESFDVIQARLVSVFHEIAEEAQASGEENILVVSHALTIKTLVYLFASSRIDEAAQIENASITRLVYSNGHFSITDLNDTRYFLAGKNH